MTARAARSQISRSQSFDDSNHFDAGAVYRLSRHVAIEGEVAYAKIDSIEVTGIDTFSLDGGEATIWTGTVNLMSAGR